MPPRRVPYDIFFGESFAPMHSKDFDSPIFLKLIDVPLAFAFFSGAGARGVLPFS